jgi:hypothetical protein
MVTEVPNQAFMSDGAAAKRSSFAVMIGVLLLVPTHDEASLASVTSKTEILVRCLLKLASKVWIEVECHLMPVMVRLDSCAATA